MRCGSTADSNTIAANSIAYLPYLTITHGDDAGTAGQEAPPTPPAKQRDPHRYLYTAGAAYITI